MSNRRLTNAKQKVVLQDSFLLQDSCRQRVKNSSFAQPAEFRHVKSEMYPQRGDAMTSPPRWRQKRSGPVCQYSPSIKFRKVTGTSCCAENRQSRALLCHSVRPYVCVYGNMRLGFSRAPTPARRLSYATQCAAISDSVPTATTYPHRPRDRPCAQCSWLVRALLRRVPSE